MFEFIEYVKYRNYASLLKIHFHCFYGTFAASAPRLWNALPRELKIATSLIYFKRLLKTHLFRIAYEQ